MSEGHMPLEEMAEAMGIVEKMDYDEPFTTFTYERWLELQAQMIQLFSRYQRAIEHNQAALASLIVLDMQQIVMKLAQEACGRIPIDNTQE